MSNPTGARPQTSTVTAPHRQPDVAEADRMEQQTPAVPDELDAPQPSVLAVEADEGDVLEQSVDVPLDSEDLDYPPES